MYPHASLWRQKACLISLMAGGPEPSGVLDLWKQFLNSLPCSIVDSTCFFVSSGQRLITSNHMARFNHPSTESIAFLAVTSFLLGVTPIATGTVRGLFVQCQRLSHKEARKVEKVVASRRSLVLDIRSDIRTLKCGLKVVSWQGSSAPCHHLVHNSKHSPVLSCPRKSRTRPSPDNCRTVFVLCHVALFVPNPNPNPKPNQTKPNNHPLLLPSNTHTYLRTPALIPVCFPREAFFQAATRLI